MSEKKSLVPFYFNSHTVRVVERDGGETWFCLKDICEALRLTNATMVAERLDDDELTKLDLGSQQGKTLFVNESGLYAVVLRSDKPEAKKFRKWVTSEVLPRIRKTGKYDPTKRIDFTQAEFDQIREQTDGSLHPLEIRDILLSRRLIDAELECKLIRSLKKDIKDYLKVLRTPDEPEISVPSDEHGKYAETDTIPRLSLPTNRKIPQEDVRRFLKNLEEDGNE
jgi:prophage antirepressor-like protein